MSMLKENLAPAIVILLAGLIVSFTVVPLQNTEWAESTRAGRSESGKGVEAPGVEVREEGDPLGGILMVVGPLIKVTILMSIGGLLTALVLRIISRIKR